ncbi:hypothetical protein DDD64_06740 [Actinotignum sanguinis]|uniref:hypothetical protein n=1 Tax=Actinotignum sanguinis TaxID=1445614 RepID=UPI000F7D7881|nr:hypothetical protein [Actinotignum sanguinis]MDY5148067.1 hypothetical protein [Actinotignum sanguinis]RTE48494.1 hypothetical protein DDD64_06740 [Actinotignum sanguinis]
MKRFAPAALALASVFALALAGCTNSGGSAAAPDSSAAAAPSTDHAPAPEFAALASSNLALPDYLARAVRDGDGTYPGKEPARVTAPFTNGTALLYDTERGTPAREPVTAGATPSGNLFEIRMDDLGATTLGGVPVRGVVFRSSIRHAEPEEAPETPSVTFAWYDGANRPIAQIMPEDYRHGSAHAPRIEVTDMQPDQISLSWAPLDSFGGQASVRGRFTWNGNEWVQDQVEYTLADGRVVVQPKDAELEALATAEKAQEAGMPTELAGRVFTAETRIAGCSLRGPDSITYFPYASFIADNRANAAVADAQAASGERGRSGYWIGEPTETTPTTATDILCALEGNEFAVLGGNRREAAQLVPETPTKRFDSYLVVEGNPAGEARLKEIVAAENPR